MKRQYLETSDGVRIPVHVAGSGRPLVILHGWTSHPQDWRPILPALAERFTCYAWEARPHHADEPVIERMGRDVHELIERFALERPLLLGHSMGAITAWEYLSQFGDSALSALCLIDQSPLLTTDEEWSLGLFGGFTAADNERFVAGLRKNFAEGVIDLISHSRVSTDGGPGIPRELLQGREQRLARLPVDAWVRAWQSFVGKDFRPVLPTITVPTFLAYGAKSNYYGVQVARYVHEHIRGSELVIYPEGAHAPHMEAMEDFLRDFDDFISRRLG